MNYFILLITSFILHPFHVSVTDIKFKKDKKVLEITSRIFVDDFEKAIQKEKSLKNFDIVETKDSSQTKTWIKEYIMKSFKLSINSRPLDIQYVGFEFGEEYDVIWCYLEVQKIRKVRELTVVNTIFTDLYDDQENIVHLRAYDEVVSKRMTRKNKTEQFKIEQ